MGLLAFRRSSNSKTNASALSRMVVLSRHFRVVGGISTFVSRGISRSLSEQE
jgi:hypothetical protein